MIHTDSWAGENNSLDGQELGKNRIPRRVTRKHGNRCMYGKVGEEVCGCSEGVKRLEIFGWHVYAHQELPVQRRLFRRRWTRKHAL